MDRFQSENYTGTRSHFRSEEDAAEYDAQFEEAAVLSACCAAEIRVEMRESSTCPETGYREEGGPSDVCAACGSDFEPMLQPVFTVRVPSKPITRQQGDLFIGEVA